MDANEVKDYMVGVLREDPIIVEAGAAEGHDTLALSQLFPKGMIYSFEPVESMFDMAFENTKSRDNIRLYFDALSDKDGFAKMYIANRNGIPWGSHSLHKPKDHTKLHPDIKFDSVQEVSTMKLDTFFEYTAIDRIDFMWLDMQGHEHKMLSSSPNALRVTKYIYTEVNKKELYHGITLYEEYKKFLFRNGFEIVMENIPWEDAGDVLFRRVKCV